MLLKTCLTPAIIRLPLINSGGRSNYLGGAFQVIPYPEGEDVVFLQKRCPNFPFEFQPFVSAGVIRACAAGMQTGKRICSVALEPDWMKNHEVDTTEEGVERLAFYFILGQLWNYATPIEPISPSCRTPDVLGLAHGYRLGGDCGQLPILADALEEAGCDNSLVLTHLRTCPDHGEQCWGVEWIEAGSDDGDPAVTPSPAAGQ